MVDAFRASTTIALLVSKGARVIPVASVEEAASYVGADYRIGERGSARAEEGFDFGNSPTEIEASELVLDATVVLSTTNGTQIIEAARGAPLILTGAFVNAHAVADALATGAWGERVTMIGCGWVITGSALNLAPRSRHATSRGMITVSESSGRSSW